MENTEPGSGSRDGQHNGRRGRTAAEEDRLLDHHIEELLGFFGDAVPTRESGQDPARQRLD
jgi:hypothetical protein